MSDSIHTARWISQLDKQGWDIHLFPSRDYGSSHKDLKNLTLYHSFYGYLRNLNKNVQYKGIPVFSHYLSWMAKTAKKFINPNYRVDQLENVIKKIKPDIIHSMEFQSAGYLTLEAKKRFDSDFPIWIATNWGSDIYYFRNVSGHESKIKEILEKCDYYSCECKRDGLLAMEMGLKGKLLPILPNTGGFEVNKYSKIRQNNPTSSRRLILLKGNQGWAGRALLGLQAIELCKEELSGYIIAIYSAGDEVKREANNLSERINVPIKIIPPCSHEEIMGIFGKSRVYIGLSITDAISTSLLEAIMMGTFPIQTNTSCASEWIIDGETGFIVPPDNPQIIAKRSLKQ
ncbi:glycosyltransferase [Methanogenium marinum]|uniref:Glycosyltransferase n=2 Tax=Methanogenium marinum TaxID=348610 RepID=A0A9Q4KRH8_9EURY|nr:glycosyltransferase [Methanogenium marinum]